jgi:serine/threonine-protein kinase
MKSRIGHYDVLAELGRGGMGVVYQGYEPALDRHVAIKVLAQSLAHDPSIKERFLREARSMAALNDPHIIQIYFIGEDEGQPYFAMEFIEGESLSSYLKREGKLSPQNAGRVIHQTALGLATAHDKGVIHRDIKPGNLMLTARGNVKIADFGIALSTQDFNKKLTSTGEFVGTPGYLSPEVCTGNPVDQRSDIFSLGIVLFEVLTGRMPFTDESPLGLLLEVVRAEIPDVRQLNADVDPQMVEILTRMTAKDPANRYASCHELAEALSHHPLLARPGLPTIKVQTPVVSALPNRGAVSLPVSRPYQTEAQGEQYVQAASTMVTPPKPPAAPPPPAYEPVAEPPRASVLSRPHKSGSGAFVAVAAVLALLLVSAGAFALRSRVPFLNSMFASVAPSLAAPEAAPAPPAPAPAAPVPPAPPAPPPAPESGAANATAASVPPDSSATAPANAATSAAQAGTGTVAATDAPPDASSGRAQNADPRPIAGTTQDPNDSASLDPLRRVAENRQGALQAKAKPPEQQAPPRGPPRVAVIAIGDPAIAQPAQQLIEEALSDNGFLIIDTDLAPGLNRLLESNRPDLPQILGSLARSHGVRAVTVVRAEPLGTTQLNYYGQSAELFSVNLTVKTYDTGNHSPVNAGFRSKVDFTALNAHDQAKEAIEPELRRYLSSLSSYRPKGTGG